MSERGLMRGKSITNYQLRITNYELPIANYELPITNDAWPSFPRTRETTFRVPRGERYSSSSTSRSGMWLNAMRIGALLRAFQAGPR